MSFRVVGLTVLVPGLPARTALRPHHHAIKAVPPDAEQLFGDVCQAAVVLQRIESRGDVVFKFGKIRILRKPGNDFGLGLVQELLFVPEVRIVAELAADYFIQFIHLPRREEIFQ